MVQSTTIQLSPKELANFIYCKPIGVTVNPKVKNLISTDKYHLTRKEIPKLFEVSLSYINYWSKKEILTPLKVDQRTCFTKPDLLHLPFQ